jgi:tetratricopeptide (TPR) repeat protein
MEKPTKLLSAETLKRFRALLPIAGVLYVLTIVLQTWIDPTAKEYRKGEILKSAGGLNSEFLLLPLLGFREAAAGLLWVRCDEFFHSGDYDAILPLVRLITWLDPHADNVYVTGAWHLSYNFTDSSERSDRRYIPPSQALLAEGIANNMHIPDIKFERAWQLYDKIKDYVGAEEALKLALATPPNKNSDDWPYGAPLKTWHVLAHTYAKQGRIPESLAAWREALKRSEEMLKAKPTDSSTQQLRKAEQHNHDLTLQRWRDRYQKDGHSSINPSNYPAVIRPAPGSTTPAPWDVSFLPKIEVTKPRVFKISGKFNSADGARIFVRISDWNYEAKEITGVQNSFAVDLTQTILIDSISVRKNRFEREMDMSKDPKMYSFSQPEYKIVLWYDTRHTSPHLQDRFGWSGEGITDNNKAHVYYDQTPALRGTKFIDGQGGEGPNWDGETVPWGQFGQPPRIIRVTYKITRAQALGQQPITDANIVSNEEVPAPLQLR